MTTPEQAEAKQKGEPVMVHKHYLRRSRKAPEIIAWALQCDACYQAGTRVSLWWKDVTCLRCLKRKPQRGPVENGGKK